jgi:hypothetical protein
VACSRTRRSSRAGVERRQFRALDLDIHRDQDGAGFDDLSGHEMDLTHGAGELVAKRHRTECQDSADRGGRRMRLFGTHLRDGHDFGRLGGRTGSRLDAATGVALPGGQPRHEAGDRTQEDDGRQETTMTRSHDDLPPQGQDSRAAGAPCRGGRAPYSRD